MTTKGIIIYCKNLRLTALFIFLFLMFHLTYMHAQTVFAVIGDYGSDDAHEAAVAAMIDTWNPSFIMTVGDNTYSGSYADDVGKYYHTYMFPHDTTYGKSDTQTSNSFWPAIGDQDWDYQDLYSDTSYKNYFTLPYKETYYTVQIGDVEFFIMDSDTREKDGTDTNSVQGQYIHSQIQSSAAKWKIVIFHHPAYSSGDNGSHTYMQWPFENWGVDAVMSGHDHDYERILRDDNSDGDSLVYFIDGLGGAPIGYFHTTAVAGSRCEYLDNWGALKVIENADSLRFEFHSIDPGYPLIDTYTINKSSLPVELTSFTAMLVQPSSVQLKWSTATEVNNYGFDIERATGNNAFNKIGFVAGSGNSNSPKNYSFTDQPAGGSIFSYRLKQIDNDGAYKYSNTITVSIEGEDKVQLMQNYPNPFNPSTEIKYTIPKSGFVTIKVYNLLGREVATLVNEEKAAGNYSVTFNGANLSSGVYFYTMQEGDFLQTKKLVLLK
jgi:tartrate-resistant acid phosphatase type 5